jgi:hypothetical protein
VLDKALSVAAAKAKLTGLVIAAAAIGGTAVAAGSTAFVPTAGEDTVTATESPSAEPTVEPTLEPTPDATPETAEEAAPAADPLPCPSDVRNHGAYVSQVAHDKSVTGRDHGKAVSEAAHSDCGKSAEDASEGEDADAEETEAPEASEAPDADEQEDGDDASSDTPKAKNHGHGHKGH